MEKETQPYESFDFVQGQILALAGIILGLAQTVPKEVFRSQSLARIEAARVTLLNVPTSDERLLGLDSIERWLREATR